MSLKSTSSTVGRPHPFRRALRAQTCPCRRQSTTPPSTSPGPGPSSPSPTPSASSSAGPNLAKILRDSIKATGPLSISRYMTLCLTHPTAGYYASAPVFGPPGTGDFTTSPEISQVFGELLGVWLLTRYLAAGSPSAVRLVELGPGRGTLMDDVLRTLGTYRQIKKKIRSVVLVENSGKMRAAQRDKLGKRARALGATVEWKDSVFELEPSEEYTLLVAHEFFDAMPVNIFERTQHGWREIMVSLAQEKSTAPADPPGTVFPSGLQLAISRDPTPLSTVLPTTSARFDAVPPGGRIEVAQESWKIMRRLAEIMSPAEGSGGGAGLVVDYGGDQVFGSSFRAFKNHQIVSPLTHPGAADLTANVDFAYLRESLAGTGLTAHGPIPQNQFLLALGLETRLHKLMSMLPLFRREDVRKGAVRLVDATGMGGQYKIMGLESSVKEGEEVYPFTETAPDQGGKAGSIQTK